MKDVAVGIICPGSSDPFYIVAHYKLGHFFLDTHLSIVVHDLVSFSVMEKGVVYCIIFGRSKIISKTHSLSKTLIINIENLFTIFLRNNELKLISSLQ